MQKTSQIDEMDSDTHCAKVVVSSMYQHDVAHSQHETLCQTFMGAAALSNTCAPPDRGGLPPLLPCSAHTAAQHVTVQTA